MDEKTEDIGRLEIHNVSDEDGFEKVHAPAEDLPDEVNFDDLDETIDSTTHRTLPRLEKIGTRDPTDPQNQSPQSPISPTALPQPLSPKKNGDSPVKQLFFEPPPIDAADSPTTAEATDQFNKLGMDEDTVMTEFGEELKDEGKQTSLLTQQLQSQQTLSMTTDDGPSELERELARPEDKPAPLFSKKDPPVLEHSVSSAPQLDGDEQQDIEQSTATLQAQDDSTPQNGERSRYETELDGSPVVGDLLKIKFAVHQVVPTILVSFSHVSRPDCGLPAH
jgi:SIT4-associating protein SAP185/190